MRQADFSVKLSTLQNFSNVAFKNSSSLKKFNNAYVIFKTNKSFNIGPIYYLHQPISVVLILLLFGIEEDPTPRAGFPRQLSLEKSQGAQCIMQNIVLFYFISGCWGRQSLPMLRGLM